MPDVGRCDLFLKSRFNEAVPSIKFILSVPIKLLSLKIVNFTSPDVHYFHNYINLDELFFQKSFTTPTDNPLDAYRVL